MTYFYYIKEQMLMEILHKFYCYATANNNRYLFFSELEINEQLLLVHLIFL